MKKIDMTNIREAGESTRLPAGAYICKITDVKDVSDKEYLKVSYDISEGEYRGYYGKLRSDHPDWQWIGSYVKSYKTAALPMFKRFCSAVSKSNGNFVFDGGSVNADETTLKGKQLGIILREEEYYSNSGDLRTRLTVFSEFPVDKLPDQKVPDVKKLQKTAEPVSDDFMSIADSVNEEVPF